MSARLEKLQARLDMYLAAEVKILEGNQSWSSPDGVSYDRGNLRDLQFQITRLESHIAALDGSGFTANTVSFGGRR